MPAAKARICRGAGILFLIFGSLSLLDVVGAMFVPGQLSFDCSSGAACVWKPQPEALLQPDDRAAVEASSAARARFGFYVRQPAVRAGLGGVTLVEVGPFAALLMCVGAALRRLGGAGDPLARALPWLRRASLAAIAWALARPIASSLLASLLSGGTPGGAYWHVIADFGAIGIALMLAITAYAAVWAVEAGVRAQRDLDSFV